MQDSRFRVRDFGRGCRGVRGRVLARFKLVIRSLYDTCAGPRARLYVGADEERYRAVGHVRYYLVALPLRKL